MKRRSTLILYPDSVGKYHIIEAPPKEPGWVKRLRAIVVLWFTVAAVVGFWWLWAITY